MSEIKINHNNWISIFFLDFIYRSYSLLSMAHLKFSIAHSLGNVINFPREFLAQTGSCIWGHKWRHSPLTAPKRVTITMVINVIMKRISEIPTNTSLKSTLVLHAEWRLAISQALSFYQFCPEERTIKKHVCSSTQKSHSIRKVKYIHSF